MDLFITEPQLKFDPIEKAAASTELDENPENWGRQVLIELYRALPQSSEFSPEVMFIKTDKEQGTGYGVVIITNDTDSALSVSRPGADSPRALVPVVVRSHQLSPLDVLMTRTGKMMPLNDYRLRQALFRPETFEMVTDDFGDSSLYSMFYPPGHSDSSYGSGMGMSSGGANVIHGPGMKYSMLQDTLPTLLRPDVDRLTRCVDAEPALVKAASENTAFLGALRVLVEAETTGLVDASALIKTALDTRGVDVVQAGYNPYLNIYWIKTANRDAFCPPKPEIMDRRDFLKWAGEEVAQKVDTQGTVTVSTTAGSQEHDHHASKWSVVDEPGIYRVKTMSGKEMTGWVIPSLIDAEGIAVPMALFTNGAAAMVQPQVAGTRVGTGVDLPAGPVKDTGVFYCSGAGGVVATIPMLILGREGETSGRDVYHVRLLSGEETRVCLTPGVKGITALKGEFFVPDYVKFLALNDEPVTPLIESPDQLDKTAAILHEPHILFWGDGTSYTMEFSGLPKLAQVSGRVQSLDDAVFTLCLGGVDALTAQQKVAKASDGYSVRIPARDIVLGQDLYLETRKIASTRSQEIVALRRYLVKEAAALPDVMTVDAVLSLGFINSENVRMYMSRLPYLEKALSMVCELLLASRIGLSEIPEYAAARCARGLDDVTQGLRALMLRKVEETPGD